MHLHLGDNNEINAENLLEEKLEDGTLTFNIASHTPAEIVRFCANGDIYVKGKLITNDIEVVDGLKEFLRLSKQTE